MDRPVQLGPVKRTAAQPTEEEVACAEQAFGDIAIGDDEPIVAPPTQREVRQAREAYQPPPCEIKVLKPQTHTLELITPTAEEEARLAKQAFNPQAHIVEIVEHMSDEEMREQRDELLARKYSIQESKEAEEDHERGTRE